MTIVAQNTRIAPSPTGNFHLGTGRTAYLNWLAARASGGKFIVRIDDTDAVRNKEECVDIIFETMEWLGLNYDGYYRQSHRTKLYQEFADTLTLSGLTKELDNGAIALKWHDRYGKSWTDSIAGEIAITDTNIQQIDGRLILLRGHPREVGQPDLFRQPTYQFASIVDDWDLGINHIIRGTDHQSNCPKQVAIWKAINHVYNTIAEKLSVEVKPHPLPIFTHVGLIFKDKKKMSKRDGAASMLHYKNAGYSPEAVLNCMLRLGWGGGEIPDKPISRTQAIYMFYKGSMKNTNVSFDPAKLDFLNKFYTKRKAA